MLFSRQIHSCTFLLLISILGVPYQTLAAPQNDTPMELLGSVRDFTNGTAVPGANVSCGDSLAITTSTGEFRLEKSPSQPCRLKAVAKGYFPDPKSNRLISPTTAMGSKPIVVNLIPAAKVSGMVRTRERQPIEGATVYLMRKSISSKERVLYTAQSVATSKDGSFLLEDIKPGKYYLLCSPPRNPIGKTALAPTFFPASVSDQDATPLVLQPGVRQFGLVLELRREMVHTISGQLISQDRLVDPFKMGRLSLSRGGNGDQARLSVDPVRAPLSPPYSRILLAADGQFRIEGVFIGSYDLSLKSNSANIEQFLGKIYVVGKDIAGLKIDYLLPSRVTGQVLVVPEGENSEKNESPPNSFWLSTLDADSRASAIVPLKSDKTFRLEALPSGSYEAFFFAGNLQRGDYYVDSVEWNGVAQSSTIFQHAGFPENKLVLRLKTGLATIRATAPADASLVVLFTVPLRQIAVSNGTAIQAEPGPDGAFTLSRVIPGRYKLCAVDSLESVNFMEWVNDPENEKTIEKFCHSMEVKRKDNLSVRLPLLSFSSDKP